MIQCKIDLCDQKKNILLDQKNLEQDPQNFPQISNAISLSSSMQRVKVEHL